MISFGYVKICLILYPLLKNSTTGIAIIYTYKYLRACFQAARSCGQPQGCNFCLPVVFSLWQKEEVFNESFSLHTAIFVCFKTTFICILITQGNQMRITKKKIILQQPERHPILYMLFDRFLLAVESRDLSQAVKSLIRVSSFPKYLYTGVSSLADQLTLFQPGGQIMPT